MTDSRPQLRLVRSGERPAGTCRSPGCRLPSAGSGGLCASCERVYRCVLELCDRLLARDLARVEHETPGLTGALRVAILGASENRPSPSPVTAAAGESWVALVPMPADLDSLNDLLSELEAAARWVEAER